METTTGQSDGLFNSMADMCRDSAQRALDRRRDRARALVADGMSVEHAAREMMTTSEVVRGYLEPTADEQAEFGALVESIETNLWMADGYFAQGASGLGSGCLRAAWTEFVLHHDRLPNRDTLGKAIIDKMRVRGVEPHPGEPFPCPGCGIETTERGYMGGCPKCEAELQADLAAEQRVKDAAHDLLESLRELYGELRAEGMHETGPGLRAQAAIKKAEGAPSAKPSETYLLQFPEVQDAPTRGTGNNYEMCLPFSGPTAQQDCHRVRDFLVAVLKRCGLDVHDESEFSGGFSVCKAGEDQWLRLNGMIWRQYSGDSEAATSDPFADE